MSFHHHAHANLFILATILSASSPASANPLLAPPHHPRIPNLPLGSPSPPPARQDRNTDKAVPAPIHPAHGAEAQDDSHSIPATAAEVSLGRRALTATEPDTLPKNAAEPAFPSMTHHSLRSTLSSQWFQPSAPTEAVPPLLPVAEAADDIDPTSGLYVLDCSWLDGPCINAVGVLIFAVMAAGTIVLLRLLWRRRRKARRRARKEGLGLRFVRRDEKAGLL